MKVHDCINDFVSERCVLNEFGEYSKRGEFFKFTLMKLVLFTRLILFIVVLVFISSNELIGVEPLEVGFERGRADLRQLNLLFLRLFLFSAATLL